MANPSTPKAGTVAPAGHIEAAATTFLIPAGTGGGKIGVMVTVLYQSQYVAGASVSVTCDGPGVTVSTSGATADRASWAPTTNPSIPDGPSAFFWTVLSGNFQEGAKYTCHGSVSYNGMTDAF